MINKRYMLKTTSLKSLSFVNSNTIKSDTGFYAFNIQTLGQESFICFLQLLVTKETALISR